ncbi:transmembrane protein 229B-like [Sycon ciliatum]|uniref:transmembrane protein 229B-like n=1 Tax=Sycon ciliatum TaxID=27933 RepID=UPI0020AE3972|eukprot:scpid75375/ scgid15393/ Transmembrane protein 229B
MSGIYNYELKGSVPLCECGGVALDSSDNKPTIGYSRVSWPYRLAFYSINAFYIEVFWTAMWSYFLEDGDLKLVGYSSVWSLIIYGLSFLVIERLYFFFLDHKITMLARGFLYMLLCFAVELAFGLVLMQFDANSWDYSQQFTYHLFGCIALEYAPLWFFGSLLFEKLAIEPCTRAAFQSFSQPKAKSS